MATLVTHTITSYATLTITASETQVDVANNRSYVTTQMSISGSNYKASTLSAGLSGATDRSGSWSGSGTVLSGGFWVTHNSDGSGTATIGYWMNTTYGNNLGYDTGTIGLTTIPRASTPSIVGGSNVRAGTTITINTNRKSTAFTHNLTATFGYHTKSWTGVTDSVTWTVPTDWLDSIAGAQWGNGALACTTMNGSTQIGDTVAVALNIGVPTDAIPKMHDWGATELNENVKALTTDGTVQQISQKDVYVTRVVAEYYSSIVSVTCNGVALAQQSDGSWHGTLSNLSSGEYKFEAKDSRGLSSGIGTTSQTYYEYTKPQLTEGSLKRTEETGAVGTLTVKGNYCNILSNKVTMTTQRAVNGSKEASKSVTPTQSDGTVSYTKDYSDLYYNNSYDITVSITDLFGEVATATIHLGTGAFALWLGKASCTLGQNSKMLDSSGTIRTLIDMFYPIGTYYETSDTSFNPNKVWGGAWEKLEDGRMLISNSASHTVGSTGGKEGTSLYAHIGAVNDNITTIGYDAVGRTPYQASHSATYSLSAGNISFSKWNHATRVSDAQTSDANVNWMNPYLVVARWHRVA